MSTCRPRVLVVGGRHSGIGDKKTVCGRDGVVFFFFFRHRKLFFKKIQSKCNDLCWNTRRNFSTVVHFLEFMCIQDPED